MLNYYYYFGLFWPLVDTMKVKGGQCFVFINSYCMDQNNLTKESNTGLEQQDD